MDMASLCRRPLVSIGSDATLREAAARLCEAHVGCLAVTHAQEPSRLVGIVTDRDLALDGLGMDGDPRELRVGDLLKGEPVAVPGGTDLRQALQAMQDAAVRRLLVVDDDGGVLGLVAVEDLAEALAQELHALQDGAARRLLMVDEHGAVRALVDAQDVAQALSGGLDALARALRAGAEREPSRRGVTAPHPAARLVYPGFGTVAMQ